MKNIYPTGTCFDDAMDWFMKNYKDKNNLLLVHAICEKDDGELYSHAWCEHDNQAFGFGLIEHEGEQVFCCYCTDIKDYYDYFKVKKKSKYDITKVLLNNVLYKTYGPWRQEYLELCHDRKKKTKP